MRSIAPYLTDRRDATLLSVCPMLMQPRFGTLAPVAPGTKRFVAAQDGIYLEAATPAIDARVRFAATPPLPYGAVSEHITAAAGLIPRELFDFMCERAVKQCPDEYAAVVLLDANGRDYCLHEPRVKSVSGGHITYATHDFETERLVLDLHSHGHGQSFFSATDDASDQDGLYFASVLGRCGAGDTITATTRLVVDGFFVPLSWHPWSAS